MMTLAEEVENASKYDEETEPLVEGIHVKALRVC